MMKKYFYHTKIVQNHSIQCITKAIYIFDINNNNNNTRKRKDSLPQAQTTKNENLYSF